MSMWNDSLFDTCSLVTLGRTLLSLAEARPHFSSVWAIEASLSPSRMRPQTAVLLRTVTRVCRLPPLPDLTRILSASSLPLAVAEVDRLTFAAAVYHRHRVVTADRGLAEALARKSIRTESIEAVLEELRQLAVPA